MYFRADYYSGLKPMAQNVELRLSPNSISVISMDAHQTEYKIKNLKLENITDDEVHVYIDEQIGEYLQIKGQGPCQAIRSLFKSKYFSLQSHQAVKIIAFLITLPLLGYLLYLTSPFLAKKIAQQISIENEMLLAKKILPELEKESLCKDQILNESLQRLANHLMARSQITYPAQIFYGVSPVKNAFAYPGGIVVIEGELIKTMETQEQLAGVLAHELQHQLKRHILTQVIRSTLIAAIWSTAMGDFSGFVFLDPSTLLTIANMKHSRDAESEADEEAVHMLVNAEIAVMPFLNFLDRLSQYGTFNTNKKSEAESSAHKIWEYVSTHPQINRGTRFNRQYGHLKTREPFFNYVEWERLKLGCYQK